MQKIQDGIFVRTQIRSLMIENLCEATIIYTEPVAPQIFLVNLKHPEYKNIMATLLNKYQNLRNMIIKLQFPDSHLIFFPKILVILMKMENYSIKELKLWKQDNKVDGMRIGWLITFVQ